MNQIQKHALSTTSETTIPAGPILKIDCQGRLFKAWVWQREGPDQIVKIAPTGAEVDPAQWVFLNTFLVDGGQFVFHAFRKRMA